MIKTHFGLTVSIERNHDSTVLTIFYRPARLKPYCTVGTQVKHELVLSMLPSQTACELSGHWCIGIRSRNIVVKEAYFQGGENVVGKES